MTHTTSTTRTLAARKASSRRSLSTSSLVHNAMTSASVLSPVLSDGKACYPRRDMRSPGLHHAELANSAGVETVRRPAGSQRRIGGVSEVVDPQLPPFPQRLALEDSKSYG